MKRISVLMAAAFVVMGAANSAFAVELKGQIRIDGSSTVFPISEAIAEEFGKVHKNVRVTVGTSGTGGGFKKIIMGEIDICDASRVIKDSEAKDAKSKGIDLLALPVSHDGITLVVNKENTWVDHLTTEELKMIWGPESKVKTWKDVRAEWPANPIKLYGPGTDSGTFDFFTEAINGKAQSSRADFTKSEDDNVLVKGVSGDKYSLGYFGYSFYVENKSTLRAIPIKHKGVVVAPTEKTINDESYRPLSRLVYIYVNKQALKKSEVKEFVRYYLNTSSKISKEVGFIPLNEKISKTTLEQFNKSQGM